MKKFSNIKPEELIKNDEKDDIDYQGEHYKIVKFEGWSILKGSDAVVCIPYLIETNQIVLRHEYVPTFKYVDDQEYHLTLVAGKIENGETPEKALFRELEEEAGIVIREDYKLEEMKPLFISKASANKYYPYILPLNERDYHEVIAKGDGTEIEEKSKSVKVNLKYINSLNSSDLITDYMLLKMKEYLKTTL